MNRYIMGFDRRDQRMVRGRRSRVLRRDCPQGQRSPLGRVLIRLLDGEVDFISISSITPMSAALSRTWAGLVESPFPVPTISFH